MECKEYFDKFLENISLNKKRIEKIDNEVEKLTDFIKEDSTPLPDYAGIRDIFIEMFIQGSIAIDACLKPPDKSEDFDVDVILILKLTNDQGVLYSPKKVLSWLKGRLEESEFYGEKIVLKERCVRINYPGDFHLDVVPMTPTDDTTESLYIPDRIEDTWHKTNPKGYITWFNEINSQSHDSLRRIVMYLKWWRKVMAPKRADIKSIIFTTLLGSFYRKGTSDAEAMVLTMESLNTYLKRCEKIPRIPNPSLKSEDFGETWSKDEFVSFKTHFNKVTTTARVALDEDEEIESLNHWRSIFGVNFPPPPSKKKDYPPKGKQVIPSAPRKRKKREFGNGNR